MKAQSLPEDEEKDKEKNSSFSYHFRFIWSECELVKQVIYILCLLKFSFLKNQVFRGDFSMYVLGIQELIVTMWLPLIPQQAFKKRTVEFMLTL